MGRYAGYPGNIIEDIELIEISVVDRPAMEQAKIAVLKSAPEENIITPEEEKSADSVADDLEENIITLEEEKSADPVADDPEKEYDSKHADVTEEQVPQEEKQISPEIAKGTEAEPVTETKALEVKNFDPEIAYISMEGAIYTKSAAPELIELAKKVDALQMKEFKADLKSLPVNDEDLTIVVKACATNKGLAEILKKMASTVAAIENPVGSPAEEDLPVSPGGAKRAPIVEAFTGLCVKRAAETKKDLNDPAQAAEVVSSLSRMEGSLTREEKSVIEAYKSYAMFAPRDIKESK